jgi:uncharacterized Tic20 family protein
MTYEPAPPPPPETDNDARTWGMLCHLSALSFLIGIPFGSVLGPLIVWLIKRNDHPFIDAQGKEALNFQLSTWIYLAVAFFSCFFMIGFVLVPIILLLKIILAVIAAISASDGKSYHYPLSIRFIS